MVQVQLRVPEDTVKNLDSWVSKGKFKNRSDAIKTIIALYEEKEKTRKFYEMLHNRSEEAKNKPEKLVSLGEL